MWCAEATAEAASTSADRDSQQVPAVHQADRIRRPVRKDTPTRRRVPDAGRNWRIAAETFAGVRRNEGQLG